MIELSFSFAWLFFVLMVIGIILILVGIIQGNTKRIGLGFGVLFLFDITSVIGSLNYRSKPTNGDVIGHLTNPYRDGCAYYNYTIHSYDPMVECIEPTPADNPYEIQPLHPVAWICGGGWWFINQIGGAIRVKVT